MQRKRMNKNSNPIDIKDKIEDKIIDYLAFEAGGQLIVTNPPVTSPADLAIKKRGEYYDGTTIYLKIKEYKKSDKEKIYRAEVIEGEFEPREDFYLLFIYFDIVTQDIADYIWLVPTTDFLKIASTSASDRKKVFIFEAPINIKEKNKYSNFLINKKTLAKTLEKIIKGK